MTPVLLPWFAPWLPAPAWADEPDAPRNEVEEVIVEAEARTVNAGSSQVTVIEVDERVPASADVATAVARAPGAVVQRIGGLGDLAQVGIRGASARQVEILLDGIPLNPEGGSAQDLSEWPLRAFERVEVYRGGTPALLGTGALGGTVNLVTGGGRGVAASVSGGSWWTGRATVLAREERGPLHVLASVDAFGTRGAFRWYDDAATPAIASDDQRLDRANNESQQLHTVLRLGVGGDRGHLRVLHTGLWRSEGLPGAVFDRPADDASYGIGRHLLALQGTARRGGVEANARVHGLLRREVLDDPGGEIGLSGPRRSVSHTRSLGARVSGRALLGITRVEAAIEAQHDDFGGNGPGTRASSRAVGRSATGLEIAPPGGVLTLHPSVRGLLVSTEAGGLRTTAAWALPTLGARMRVGATMWAKANAGLAARPPDPLELFGDRGPFVGNPALRPERSAFVDAGLGVAVDHVEAELVAFARRARDQIVWAQLPQGVARAENLDEAAILGLEGALTGQHGPLEAGAQLAVIRAVDRSESATVRGAQLPRVPVLAGGTQVGLTLGAWRLATDLEGRSSVFADPANLRPLGARVLWGATARWSARGDALALELDVRNLLDQLVVPVPGRPTPAAMVDVSGYPLPGRTFWLTLRVRR